MGVWGPPVPAMGRQIRWRVGMTRLLATVAVAATLTAGAVALPDEANATCFGCYVGAGVVAGALLGAAIASPPPVYACPATASVYYAAPTPPPTCYSESTRVTDDYFRTGPCV